LFHHFGTAGRGQVTTSVWSNTVSKIATSNDIAEIDKAFTLTFTFADNSKPIGCGIKIDWGDGKTDRLRFGDGQQVLPPYTIEHTYKTAGQFKLQINGDLISRGLKTVFGCEVKKEGTLTVYDPIEVARLAQEKSEADKRRREQAEAQQLANQALLAKASIKSCDQFVEVFKQRYEFAYDWPNLNCVVSSENESAFKIVANNPRRSGIDAYNRFYYQPKTETVFHEGARYNKTLRVANFIDVQKATDMNAGGDIELKNLPPSQQQQVCSKINNAASSIILEHEFRITAGFEVAEIAKAGNWEFTIMKTDKSCAIKFDVAGTYQGTSHRKSVTCGIGSVSKRGDNYQVISVDVSAGNRCR